MTTPVPANPKIYHIVHIDKLASIVADGCLWSDGEVHRRDSVGTTIGMDTIKKRRLEELTLTSYLIYMLVSVFHSIFAHDQ